MSFLGDLAPAAPELLLAFGAMALLMLGVAGRQNRNETVLWGAVGLIAAAGLLVVWVGPETRTLFDGSFRVDDFARVMKLLVLIGSGVTLAMSIDYLRRQHLLKFELPVLVLLSTLGMMLMISANDLIALYVGLELQSLALYVIAAFRRDAIRSSEAGLKYFVLGSLSSGMLLYGASLIYGFTGSTEFARIAQAISGAGPSIGLTFGLVFIMAGLAFKIAAVPFHMWTPDVYEGAPTPMTAFFAAAPKLAAMALTIRVLYDAFPGLAHEWRQIVTFISIASMGLGAFAAIGQTNIKRLMAYSSIGHVGYALIGLAAGGPAGVQGVIVYLAIYLAMTLGSFAVILGMRRGSELIEDIASLAGLSRTKPMVAFLFAMLLFSLAGIPPLAGFFAKFYVFLAAMQAELYPLAVIGVLASVVGAYYYLRIIKIMYLDQPSLEFEPMPISLKAVLGAAGAFNLLFFLQPQPLADVARAAANSLF